MFSSESISPLQKTLKIQDDAAGGGLHQVRIVIIATLH